MINATEPVKTLREAAEKNSLYPGSRITWLLLSACGGLVIVAGEGTSLEKAEKTLTVAALAVPIAIALWQIGSFWDDWLFDPVFKPKTDKVLPWLGREMRDARLLAASFLTRGPGATNRLKASEIEGVYGKADKLCHNTEAWAEHVKPPLEWSKFFRSLIILPLSVFLYDSFQQELPRLTAPDNVLQNFTWLEWSSVAWLGLALAIIFAGLYVSLRLRHMRALYQLVTPGNEIVFETVECAHDLSIKDECQIDCDGYLLAVNQHQLRRVYRPDHQTARSLRLLSRLPSERWKRHEVLEA